MSQDNHNSNSHTGSEKVEAFARVTFKPKEQQDSSVQFLSKNNSTTRAQPQSSEQRGSNSSQTMRPQLRKLPSQCVEEGVCRGKYFETLEEGSGFHKKEGYFTEYLRQTKNLSDQYKIKKLPSQGHSRYISKPVFFTTLKSKNKLTDNILNDHSELLEIAKQTSPQNAKSFITTPGRLNKQSSIPMGENIGDAQTSNLGPILPSFQTRKTLERTQSQNLLRHRAYTPSASPKKLHRDSPQSDFKRPGHGDTTFTKTVMNFNTLSTITGSELNFFEEEDKSKNVHSLKHQSTIDELKNPKNVRNLTKYYTRQLTQALATRCAERSKMDADEFMQHKTNADYPRQTSMAFTSTNKHRKSQMYSGSPKFIRPNRVETGYKESNTLEEIEKFEEGISGWTKSVPNFGKQRWTYDKSWEFRII